MDDHQRALGAGGTARPPARRVGGHDGAASDAGGARRRARRRPRVQLGGRLDPDPGQPARALAGPPPARSRPATGARARSATRACCSRHITCMLVRGVPTVVPARALFEVAGTRRRGAELPWWVERMERMVDAAWGNRLVERSVRSTGCCDELAQRGRPGIRVMRQVLAERPIDYDPPASGLESRVAQILRRAGFGEFRRQVDLGDDAAWIGRVDFVAEGVPLVVEVQSELYHSSVIDRRDDRSRFARLRCGRLRRRRDRRGRRLARPAGRRPGRRHGPSHASVLAWPS